MRLSEVPISFRAQRKNSQQTGSISDTCILDANGTRMALLVVEIVYFLITLKRMLENLLNACIMCRRIYLQMWGRLKRCEIVHIDSGMGIVGSHRIELCCLTDLTETL